MLSRDAVGGIKVSLDIVGSTVGYNEFDFFLEIEE
jgi:hypothetical protein